MALVVWAIRGIGVWKLLTLRPSAPLFLLSALILSLLSLAVDYVSLGQDLFIHQQGIDTTTPAGKALFGMMGVFAEFERSMIQE